MVFIFSELMEQQIKKLNGIHYHSGEALRVEITISNYVN
jgi:hypothetical protein